MENQISYYDKKTGEEVYIFSGEELIKEYWDNRGYKIAGHTVKRERYSQVERGSYFYIEDVGIITADRYVVISNEDNLKILREEEVKVKYSKYKRIKNRFLKIERENTVTYIEVSTINYVTFTKEDGKKCLWFNHRTGVEIINYDEVSNYDEVEEILKNYVEE